jgi:hypothetical protein
LIYPHVNPYVMFELDMTKRLTLEPQVACRASIVDRKKVFTAK